MASDRALVHSCPRRTHDMHPGTLFLAAVLRGAVKGGAGFAALCVAMDYVMEEYLSDRMGGDGFG